MKVRLSASARAFVRQEAGYLRERNRIAAGNFVELIKTATKDLQLFAAAGFEGEDLPMPGTRRLVRSGYRIDYMIDGNDVLIAAISSSVNSPLGMPGDDDDFDYEASR